MAELREDVVAYPLLVDLLACVEAEYSASELPIPEIWGVEPGQLPAYDLAGDNECAQGWVILQSIFPSTDFPAQDFDTLGVANQLGMTIQVGTLRCIPTLDENGDPPTMEQRLEATRVQLADMAAMKRAICACLKTAKRDFILGTYQPVGPDGGQVGGTWTVTVRWPGNG